MGTDDAQRRDADGQHGVAGGKEAQHLIRQELEDAEAHQHDALGVEDCEADGLFDPLRLPCAVVVADDGDHAVVHTEDGHEHEALQLEVDAEDGDSRGREGHQDLVHEEGHHAAHALHGDAGQADGVDAADGLGAGPEAPEADLDVGVLIEVEVQRHARAAELADDGGRGSAGGAGQGLAAVAEDEDGVENDIHDSAHQLADHTQMGAAGGSQRLLAHGLGKEAEAEHAAELQILDALPGNVHVRSLCVEVGFHAGEADDEEDGVAAQGQEDAVLGGLIGPFLVLFAEALGQQGVDAHAGADAHGDHDVLQRERQRNGGQGVFADMGHENRVHHVVEGLHQHGYHHRHAELDEQRVDVHGTHDVFPLTGGRG